MEPPNLEVVSGDLLAAEEQYICHQCNCVTTHGKYLSASLFERFPYADIYSNRTSHGEPGNIIIRGDPDRRWVIALLAQYYPGRSRYASDTAELREGWFRECLIKVSQLPGLRSLAFPYGIGCGAAGGNWHHYYEMISLLARKRPDIQIRIYRLPIVG